jgi:hypothetical protein
MSDNPLLNDSNTLAGIVQSLGGTMRSDPRGFRFDLPLADVREVIPKLNKLGVGVRKVSEYTEHGPKTRSVAVLELYRPQKGSDHIEEF